MNADTKKVLLVFLIFICLCTNVHAGFFGDLITGAGNFVSGVVGAAVNMFVTPIVNTISAAATFVSSGINKIATNISNVITSVTPSMQSLSKPTTPIPPKGTDNGTWEPHSENPTPNVIGDGDTDVYTRQGYTHEITATHAQLEITNFTKTT